MKGCTRCGIPTDVREAISYEEVFEMPMWNYGDTVQVEVINARYASGEEGEGSGDTPRKDGDGASPSTTMRWTRLCLLIASLRLLVIVLFGSFLLLLDTLSLSRSNW